MDTSTPANGGTSTFKGKRGTLVLRTTGKTNFMEPDEVWIGTWRIVRGTGTYAGLKGTGGYTAVHPGISPTPSAMQAWLPDPDGGEGSALSAQVA